MGSAHTVIYIDFDWLQVIVDYGRWDFYRSIKVVRSTYPHEYQHFGVANAVFAFGDTDHRELGRAGALLNQIANLKLI